MSYVLRDRDSGRFFCHPYGDDMKEWSHDPTLAYQFITIERAQGGREVWKNIHHKELTVIPFSLALTKHATNDLRIDD